MLKRLMCSVIGIYLVAISQFSAAQEPAPSQSPPGVIECSIEMKGSERCPVCAMNPSEYPKSAASLECQDGGMFYFCGNGCMIRSVLQSETYLKIPRSEIRRVCVRNYFTGEAIDGMSAFYAGGSDVMGPMGPAWVAFSTEAERDTFETRHPSRYRFRLDSLTLTQWQAMTRKPESK